MDSIAKRLINERILYQKLIITAFTTLPRELELMILSYIPIPRVFPKWTLYCKEIHFYDRGETYIIKYYGVTNNFMHRKHLYSINDSMKTTFIQCCIKRILSRNEILFDEFPITMIKNDIVSNDDSYVEELKMVLKERKKNRPNEIILGSFFTFPLWKIRNERNPVNFLIHFGKNISHKFEKLSYDEIIILRKHNIKID